jgi:hypothetical protein
MQLLAIIILFIALFLLYRIAYPKQSVEKKGNDALPDKPKTLPDVVGKSNFVLPHLRQPKQTPTTLEGFEKEVENAVTFAPESEKKRSAVIPAEQLDDVFSDKQYAENSNPPNDEDDDDGTGIVIDDDTEDDDQTDIDEAAEEAEELNRALGHQAIYADGIDFDDLQTVAKIIDEQPNEVSKQTADTITALEHTDMFEMLISGDESKSKWIKTIIERNVQKVLPEMESDKSDTTDYGDFLADFLE